MPTAQLVYDDQQAAYAIERMQIETASALAELNRQIETVLVAELAKLPPHERRLLRWELADVASSVDHNTKAGTWTMVLEQDPPKVWTVERGGPEDTLDATAAAALVRAGAGPCLFGAGAGEPCPVSLCDACHPESWATDTVPAR